MPHLFVAVTAHGYGHVAQVAPIVAALAARVPNLRVSLQGDVAADFVAARMPPGFRQIAEAADVALPMDGPLHARWDEGLACYCRFDAEYPTRLARQRQRFAQDRPDLVLADVPWLPLEAARSLGIPSVGLCSLSWYDIMTEGPVGDRLPATVASRMRDAYAGADLFIRPAPSMPMSWLPNGRDVGPIAVQRRCDPAALRARLGVDPSDRLVLMQFGGAGRLTLPADHPLPPRVQILTPDAQIAAGGANRHRIGAGELLDVLASCDAILTKPGYGTFAEAACNGIPVLYVPRGDWPEEPHLVDWLARRVPTRALAANDLAAGRIGTPLEALFSAPPTSPVAPSGVDETVALLLPWLL